MKKILTAGASAAAFLATTAVAHAGILSDMTAATTTEMTAAKADLSAFAPTLIAWVIAVGGVLFVFRLLRGVVKG